MLYLNPKELADEVKKYVVGQDEAIDKTSVHLFQYLLYHYSQHGDFAIQNKQNLLLMGDSGSGKTFIVKTIAKLIGFNFIEINMASISKSGWSGISFIDMLRNHVESINDNFYNIVFLDEFDKFCSPKVSSGGENVADSLQAELLKILEGESITLEGGKKSICTKNICFIIGGNFEVVRKSLSTTPKSTVGFVESSEKEKKSSDEKLASALEKFGVIPEMIGRISDIVELNNLTEKDLREILLNDTSIYKTYQKVLEGLGNKFELTNEEIDSIISNLSKNKLGARGLFNEFNKYLFKFLLKNPEVFEFVTKYFAYREYALNVLDNILDNPSHEQ